MLGGFGRIVYEILIGIERFGIGVGSMIDTQDALFLVT